MISYAIFLSYHLYFTVFRLIPGFVSLKKCNFFTRNCHFIGSRDGLNYLIGGLKVSGKA